MKQARKRGVWCFPRVRARSGCAEVSRQRELGRKRRERRVCGVGLVASVCCERAATRLRWRRMSRRVYTARADARLGHSCEAGLTGECGFSSKPPKRIRPPKNSRAQSGPFAVENRVLFLFWASICPRFFCPWSCLPHLAADWSRAKEAKMESRAVVSLVALRRVQCV